ncbi:Multiple sugar ABC transporter, ATP-binding protein [hydrothermal vent metagenome]|uniref:Multiple sugar ABC transporter, ATP-binding protein n=1 Tax=hydrothermal vent metagenome TaxID=652676 RepID=A0A1W1EDR8_9ZZZZ
MTLADKIAIMNKGIIQQFDTPENVYANPCNLFTAGFIGSPSMNFIDVMIEKKEDRFFINLKNSDGEDNILFLKTDYEDIDKYVGKVVTAGLRPEHIQNGFRDIKATINFSELTGADGFLFITLNDTEVISRVSPSGVEVDGTKIDLKVWVEKIVFFDKDTEDRIR